MLNIKRNQNKMFFSRRENHHVSQRKNEIMNLGIPFFAHLNFKYFAQFYLLAWIPFYKITLANGGERIPSSLDQSAPMCKVTS